MLKRSDHLGRMRPGQPPPFETWHSSAGLYYVFFIICVDATRMMNASPGERNGRCPRSDSTTYVDWSMQIESGDDYLPGTPA